MYEKITDDNPYKTPMKIYPAVHYTMGGIWVDYNLMTTIPGCYAAGEANFSDHGANRSWGICLDAGTGRRILSFFHTQLVIILAGDIRTGAICNEILQSLMRLRRLLKRRIEKFINNKGTKSVDHFHKRLGKVMWDKVGMARNEKGLKEAIEEIRQIREEFHKDVFVPGAADHLNPELEKALRVEDFLELGELFAHDALGKIRVLWRSLQRRIC